jgi:hypothetical protein
LHVRGRSAAGAREVRLRLCPAPVCGTRTVRRRSPASRTVAWAISSSSSARYCSGDAVQSATCTPFLPQTGTHTVRMTAAPAVQHAPGRQRAACTPARCTRAAAALASAWHCPHTPTPRERPWLVVVCCIAHACGPVCTFFGHVDDHRQERIHEGVGPDRVAVRVLRHRIHFDRSIQHLADVAANDLTVSVPYAPSSTSVGKRVLLLSLLFVVGVAAVGVGGCGWVAVSCGGVGGRCGWPQQGFAGSYASRVASSARHTGASRTGACGRSSRGNSWTSVAVAYMPRVAMRRSTHARTHTYPHVPPPRRHARAAGRWRGRGRRPARAPMPAGWGAAARRRRPDRQR